MPRILKLLIVGLLLMSTGLDARAWSSTATETYHQLFLLAHSVEEYREEHGRLPSPETYRTEIDDWDHQEGPPTDRWNHQIIYRIPGEHGDFDLYSAGANGIDDRGGKDDISSWHGVNDGYYWMEWWPMGRSVLIGSMSLAVLLFISNLVYPRPATLPVAGLAIGLGMGLGCFLLLHPGVVPDRNSPLSIASFTGVLVFVISLLKLRSRMVSLR